MEDDVGLGLGLGVRLRSSFPVTPSKFLVSCSRRRRVPPPSARTSRSRSSDVDRHCRPRRHLARGCVSSVPCAACWDFLHRPAPFALASRTVVCTCRPQRLGERAPASFILLTVMRRKVGRSRLFMLFRDRCILYAPAPPPLPPCPLRLPNLLPRHQ